MDYWEECVRVGLEEAGIKATDEQVQILVGSVEGGHENYGMAHGHDCILNPVDTEATRTLARMKREKDQHDNWVSSTKPCRSCTTTGLVLDGWGRDQTCGYCGGQGRV